MRFLTFTIRILLIEILRFDVRNKYMKKKLSQSLKSKEIQGIRCSECDGIK